MQAIILAAGMGKRLKDLTRDNTKCMVEVNGKSLIERALQQLDDLSLERIVIVIGYKGDLLQGYIGDLDVKTPVVFVENPVFDSTNNIYSLYLAKDYLVADDTLLLESDLVFDDGILEELVRDPRPTLALVDKYESWMDGTVVTLDDEDNIIEFIPGKRFEFEDIPSYYKTVNIYKFSKDFSNTHYVPFLEAYSKALGNNEYYEQVLRVITLLDGSEVRAKRLSGQRWYEIDDMQDLDIAESIFLDDDLDRAAVLQSRYGGYWRYPKLIDFCYLVNPFYPPQRLMDEMKANFETLLCQYPSGLRVNCLLAAKTFGVKEDYIVVGNGAAELIKALAEEDLGVVGIVRPTFEEYPNRLICERVIAYMPDNAQLRYTTADLKSFFSNEQIDTLILINPDNPSGNYIGRQDCLDLIEWCKANEIRAIIDESFVDFSDEPQSSLVENDVLEQYENLIVVKSISKSYGVPGIRLGFVASGNKELIQRLKSNVSIWNINSFGEFYLQIAERYAPDYQSSLRKLREARSMLAHELARIEGLEPLPSQANYITVRLQDGIFATELTKRIFDEYELLIKDLTGKIPPALGQYIRVAVRDNADNEKLVAALKRGLSTTV